MKLNLLYFRKPVALIKQAARWLGLHTIELMIIIAVIGVIVAIAGTSLRNNAITANEAKKPIAYDSSDNAAEGKISGMGVHIDNLTGCHYLSGPGVGNTLTQRVDTYGNHICTGYPK